jgi:transcriptional regulator with XRE-family HTH domain
MTDADLGSRIAALRQQAALSQEQLAAQLRLDRFKMCKIEKGERKVSARELRGIAEYLACDVDFILYPEFSGSPRFRASALGNGADGDLAWLRRFRRRYDDLVVRGEA